MKLYNNAARNKKEIALTFDDGPNPYWTKKFLNILKHFGIKANFFLIGKWCKRWPSILRDIYREGHLIGNHSYSHPQYGNGDFERAEEIITKIIKTRPIFIRPPHNNNNLCKEFYIKNSTRIRVVNNDVYSLDWKSSKNDIINNVIKNTQNGSIILLHDGSQRKKELKDRPKQTYLALPEIISILLAQKYSFKRLDEMSFEN